MDEPQRPRILCVDDEPRVLEALELTLDEHFDVDIAESGAEALELIAAAEEPYATIVSDMRMPGMDGAEFLARARDAMPDAVRLLLTGHADLDAAIAAVNQAQIFRFLTKPCPGDQLLAAIRSAVKQHELIIGQRVLLEQTLQGCIKALTDVLALSDPECFGESEQLREVAADIAERLSLPDAWQVSTAATLWHLGRVALSRELIGKLRSGAELTAEQQREVDGVVDVSVGLIRNIPRLEGVIDIIERASRPREPGAMTDIVLAAEALRGAVRFVTLAAGEYGSTAIGQMRADSEDTIYHPDVLAALDAFVTTRGEREVLSVPLSDVRAGMVFADDVTLPSGLLLAAKGYVVTERFVHRSRNYAEKLKEPVRVVVSQLAS